MNQVFFLGLDTYLVSIILVGVIIGFILPRKLAIFPLIAAALFASFAFGQFIFRISTDLLAPERAIGQVIYFSIFCFTIAIVCYLRRQ